MGCGASSSLHYDPPPTKLGSDARGSEARAIRTERTARSFPHEKERMLGGLGRRRQSGRQSLVVRERSGSILGQHTLRVELDSLDSVSSVRF